MHEEPEILIISRPHTQKQVLRSTYIWQMTIIPVCSDGVSLLGYASLANLVRTVARAKHFGTASVIGFANGDNNEVMLT